MKMKAAIAASAIVLATSVGAVAQNVNSKNLVEVNVSNIANNIARDLKVKASEIPGTVQAPIGVAAKVCGVKANVLAQKNKGGKADCEAKNSSKALNQIVQRNLTKQ